MENSETQSPSSRERSRQVESIRRSMVVPTSLRGGQGPRLEVIGGSGWSRLWTRLREREVTPLDRSVVRLGCPPLLLRQGRFTSGGSPFRNHRYRHPHPPCLEPLQNTNGRGTRGGPPRQVKELLLTDVAFSLSMVVVEAVTVTTREKIVSHMVVIGRPTIHGTDPRRFFIILEWGTRIIDGPHVWSPTLDSRRKVPGTSGFLSTWRDPTTGYVTEEEVFVQ